MCYELPVPKKKARPGGALDLRILSGGKIDADNDKVADGGETDNTTSYTGVTGSLSTLSLVGVSGLTVALTDLVFKSNTNSAGSGDLAHTANTDGLVELPVQEGAVEAGTTLRFLSWP